jgi:hypothetical protein
VLEELFFYGLFIVRCVVGVNATTSSDRQQKPMSGLGRDGFHQFGSPDLSDGACVNFQPSLGKRQAAS